MKSNETSGKEPTQRRWKRNPKYVTFGWVMSMVFLVLGGFGLAHDADARGRRTQAKQSQRRMRVKGKRRLRTKSKRRVARKRRKYRSHRTNRVPRVRSGKEKRWVVSVPKTRSVRSSSSVQSRPLPAALHRVTQAKPVPDVRDVRKVVLPPFGQKLSAQQRIQGQKITVNSRLLQIPSKSNQGPTKTLAQVLREIPKTNLDVRILQKRMVQAEMARTKAWSVWQPTLSAQAGYNYVQGGLQGLQQPGQAGGQISGFSTPHQVTMSLNLNWNILHFSNIPAVQRAALVEKQVGRSLAQARREVDFAVARAYYGILLADGIEEIALSSWKNSKAYYERALARLKAGLGTDVDVLRAKLDLAKAQQTWQNARNSLRSSRLSLALLLGQPALGFRPKMPLEPQLPAGKETDWVRLAKARRVEVQAGQLAVQIAQKTVTQMLLQFVPTVGVSASVSTNNMAGNFEQAPQWSLGVQLKLPLYTGGSRYLGLRDARVHLQKTQLELKQTQQSVENEVKKASVQLQNALRSVQIATQQVGLSQRTLRLNQTRYRSGLATPLAVLDANNQWFSSSISELQARLNRDLAILSLQRAIGGLHPQLR